MRKPSTFVVHAAMASVSVLFAINYIISKLGMHVFNPLTFAYLRVLAAAIILNSMLRERNAAPLEPGDGRRLVAYSILGVVINQTFFLAGLALTTAHAAAILITTIPIFALAAGILLGRESPTVAKIGGIALSAAGAIVLIGGEGFSGTTRSLIGDLMIVTNSLSYALYLVFSKPAMARMSARRVISRMFAIAAVVMLPIAAWPMLHEPWRAIPTGAWGSLAFVVAGPTVAAYLMNAWALKYAESSVVAAYTYLQPVFAVILAAIFLQEEIKPIALLAGAMIVAGVYISGTPRLRASA
ncbi:MAG TPA: DMT family transporter [Thermoanaerobaculia bacterium]|nr:DMT family transporter [Thermoanaerobaculia bacterium]